MEYGQDITKILYEAGNDGLTVKKLAMHVYNLRNGLFETVTFGEVYKDTAKYVKRNSKSAAGMIEKAEKWGHYRINKKARRSVQLLIDFNINNAPDCEEPGKGAKPEEDKSLSLF